MNTKKCIRCYVSGKVQGVYYRATAQTHARTLNISGWAKNLSDGRVEVVACGDSTALEHYIALLKEGPKRGRVDECLVEEIEITPPTDFKVM